MGHVNKNIRKADHCCRIMPVQKRVLPLSNLCIQIITQLLIEIISMHHHESNSKTEISKDTQEQQDSSHEGHQHPENIKAEDNHIEISEQEAAPFFPNQQNSEEGKMYDNGQQNIEQAETCSSIPKNSEQKIMLSQIITNEDTHDQFRESETGLDQSLTGSFSSIRSTLEEKNAAQIIEKEIKKENKLEVIREELSQLLTSHSHVTLHDHLFESFTVRLDPLYMHNKKVRPAIQCILVHFINSTLRYLDFGKAKMFSEASMCKVLFEHLHNATRLDKLVIGRSCYWRSQIFEMLSAKLVCMPYLTILKIQYIGTPEMIHDLSSICPKLCELSLKGSEKITDHQCEEIAKCTGLVSLDISGTRITGRGCWKILDSIKNLSWLHHCAFNCNSDSIVFESRADLFNCIKKQLQHGENALPLVDPQVLNVRDVRFNLKNFWLFNPFTEDLLTTVLCPCLEHLRLDFVFQDLGEEPDVSILSSLSKIKKLEVNLYDRCIIDLISRMVEGCGVRLTTLELHLVDDWFFVAQAHNVVASCCPNLITLNFSGDYKARHSLEECDNQLDFGIPTPAHPHLKHIKLVGVVSDQRLNFLLSHTPALHTLRLDGELEWLHDTAFIHILRTNPLPHLEEMWFNVSTTVTLDTVRLLLQQDNALKHIGRLCYMNGATMGKYQELLTQVRQHNLDIKLIWVTDERTK
ncbi:uncharacterized protein [Cherax quadricarinatus]